MRTRVVAAVSKRWGERGVSKCLLSWQAWTRRQVSLQHLSACCCRKLVHRGLSRSFLTWLDWTFWQIQARGIATKVVLHFARRLCTRALYGWLAAIKRVASQERIVRKAVLRVHNRCAAQALGSWCWLTTEQKRLRQSGTRVVARMQHRLSGRALRSWCQHCRTMKRVRQMATRWLHRLAMECFDIWNAQMMQERQRKESASHLRVSRQKIVELQELHTQDTRNIKFLEALVNEQFQALESTESSIPGTRTAPTTSEDHPAPGTAKQQYFTRPPESVPPLSPYSYRGTGAER